MCAMALDGSKICSIDVAVMMWKGFPHYWLFVRIHQSLDLGWFMLLTGASCWTNSQGTTVVWCHDVTVKLGHYNDVILSKIGPPITSLTNHNCLLNCLFKVAVQRKHLSSASLAFVGGIHWWLVNSPHKGPVVQKMFPFGDVIMSRKKSIFDVL